ncbi:MAG TPA: hypothetical protein VGK73_35390 [Polyangiaceae bacterium]
MSRFSVSLVLVTLMSTFGCGDAASEGDDGGGRSGGGTTGGTGGAGAGGIPAQSGAGAGGNAGLPQAGRGGNSGAGGSAGSAGGAGEAGASGKAGTGGAAGRGGGAGAGSGGTSGASGGSLGTAGAAGGSGSGGSAGTGGTGGMPGTCNLVTEVPESVRSELDLDPFYKKHADADGVSVLASDEPEDESLLLACRLLENMLGGRDDVRQELIRRGARFAIIGRNEGTAEIPEYGYRDRPQADIDYINQRARGLGGIVASCGEENILCLDDDRYYNESICVHEFSHTISMYGVYGAERTFEDELQDAFESARDGGILEGTYRGENLQEYWAEGVQDWYDTNASSNPPNGVHNSVNTRPELADFDPTLYALIGRVFPEERGWGDCHANPPQ